MVYSILFILLNHVKEVFIKMYKYKVVYVKDEGLISIEIEASAVVTLGDTIVFLDKHGEDDYVFNSEDVVVYYTI